MALTDLALWLNFGGAICWAICFWWMHRISTTQNAMLVELREQAERIEQLSKEEHDLIKDVHPKVGEIKDKLADVADDVKHRQ